MSFEMSSGMTIVYVTSQAGYTLPIKKPSSNVLGVNIIQHSSSDRSFIKPTLEPVPGIGTPRTSRSGTEIRPSKSRL
ncbi:MAG: hypothetical protein V7L21_23130 [Nostoc sp.]|uniref:hypothetical protein n=1 Tax=Nostoc sp. TaxID=1180 RepID=UPI002FFB4333